MNALSGGDKVGSTTSSTTDASQYELVKPELFFDHDVRFKTLDKVTTVKLVKQCKGASMKKHWNATINCSGALKVNFIWSDPGIIAFAIRSTATGNRESHWSDLNFLTFLLRWFNGVLMDWKHLIFGSTLTVFPQFDWLKIFALEAFFMQREKNLGGRILFVCLFTPHDVGWYNVASIFKQNPQFEVLKTGRNANFCSFA